MNRSIRYDGLNKRLVFVLSSPNQQYWEQLWNPLLSRESIKRGNRFVTKETLRVLPKGSRVLDAGCGIGATVSGLLDAGYAAEGIDYAEQTVEAILNLAPELPVKVADVRALPYADGELDGVWSLGVIEHFYDGYIPIIVEARRVLRSGGFLFLTVPVISMLKAARIRLGAYSPFTNPDRSDFFQFAFEHERVARSICSEGFTLRRSFGRSGAFGLSEDLPRLTRTLQLRPDAGSFVARAWWRFGDILLTPFCQHTQYFLFQKNEHNQSEINER